MACEGQSLEKIHVKVIENCIAAFDAGFFHVGFFGIAVPSGMAANAGFVHGLRRAFSDAGDHGLSGGVGRGQFYGAPPCRLIEPAHGIACLWVDGYFDRSVRVV